MPEANRLPPKMNGLFPAVTVKDVVRNAGQPHAVVSMDASEKWVPKHPRCLGKSQTLMKPSNSQLSSHVPPKAVSLSFAGSRLSLFLTWEQCCFKERRRIPGALQCKTLAALKAPVARIRGQQIPLKIDSCSGCQNVSQGLGFLFKPLLFSLVCILPLIFSILLLLAIFQ